MSNTPAIFMRGLLGFSSEMQRRKFKCYHHHNHLAFVVSASIGRMCWPGPGRSGGCTESQFGLVWFLWLNVLHNANHFESGCVSIYHRPVYHLCCTKIWCIHVELPRSCFSEFVCHQHQCHPRGSKELPQPHLRILCATNTFGDQLTEFGYFTHTHPPIHCWWH